MDEIIAALRLAKERAIESENWDDLARFRDAEKIAMTTRALLFRYSDSLMEARRIIALPPPSENRWNNGFTEGGQWVLDYISVSVMAPYDDNEESDDE